MSSVFRLPSVLFFHSARRHDRVDMRLAELGLRRQRRHSCPISPFRMHQRVPFVPRIV